MLDLGKIGYKVEIDDKKYTAMLRKMEGNAKGTADNIGSIFRKALSFLGGAMLFRQGLRGARMFSDELANIKSIAGELNTRKLRREIMNLSSDLGSSAELANALYFAYSAGVRGSEKELAAFAGQMAALAKTVGADATPVMDAATTMMNAYGLSVKDAGMLSDWFYQIVKSGKTTGAELAQSLGQIAATAASSGISIDELGAALATLTTTMPTRIAVTGLAASIRSLMNPTDDVKKQAAELGIELSMAAIKAKGFAGVMEDIFQKTGGRGDLIGKLFPAESSRAIMALAGTQINTLKQNVTDFGDKGGTAAVGFTEKMQSLDERIKALQVTGKKLLTILADMVVQFVTLGGVLNPFLGWLTKLDERGIALIARMLALVAGLFAIRKAAMAYAALRTKVLLAIIAETEATNANSAANAKNTASKVTNAAASKGLATANITLTGTLKALWAAMLANPLTTILALIGAVAAGIVLLSDYLDNLSKKRAEYAKSAAEEASKARRENAEMQKMHMNQADRLEELSKKWKLTNKEQGEAKRIIRSLATEYKYIGVELDSATGKLNVQADAFDRLRKSMEKIRRQKAQDEIQKRKDALQKIDDQYSDKFGGKKGNPFLGAGVPFLANMLGIDVTETKNPLAKFLLHPLIVGGRFGAKGKLSGMTDEQLKNMRRQGGGSDEEKIIIKEMLDARKALREAEVGKDMTEAQIAAEATRIVAERVAAEKESTEFKRQSALFDAQSEALADGAISKADELNLLELQIAQQKERALEADKELAKQQKGTAAYDKADAASAEAWQKYNEMSAQYDKAALDVDKQRFEAARQLGIQRQQNELAADGELSRADRLLVRENEIAWKVAEIARLKDASALAERQAGRGSAEHLAALNEQEKAQAELYSMKNRQRQDKIDYANQQRSLQQQLRMNRMIAKLRADGEYSTTDQISVQEQKLSDMAENIKAAKAELDKLTGDAKLEMQVKISQMEVDRMVESMNLKQMKESGQKSQGSFSAELLNLMSGSQAPAEQTAEYVKKNYRETKELKNNLKNTKLVYGSK